MGLAVGFVGWRGVVGQVLRERFAEDADRLQAQDWTYFTTSQMGESGPQDPWCAASPLADAYDRDRLMAQDVVISCQGGAYTKAVYGDLRAAGWQGYWIDAASTLRYSPDSTIVLEPVNSDLVSAALKGGCKTYVGGNCTVSLLLLALGSLIKEGLVEWIHTSSYQAASGAGAEGLRQLMAQWQQLGALATAQPPGDLLAMEGALTAHLQADSWAASHFGAPVAGNVLPWIDSPMTGGQTKEEWKAAVETQKILNLKAPLPMDGTCVRVGALRCHSQAVTLRLRQALPLAVLEEHLKSQNKWVQYVPNEPQATLAQLTPAAVSGTFNIAVGRLRRLQLGEGYVGLFTVGDQLLWGAAEPLRLMYLRLLQHFGSERPPRTTDYLG